MKKRSAAVTDPHARASTSMNMITNLKVRLSKFLPALAAVAVLGSAGGYEAYHHLSGADCCYPGAPCCHPGAACCAAHKAQK
jgi:hypothetical protein